MSVNKHQYIYVYQTINEVNGKSYVGLHSTNNLEDGYIGCGIFSQAHATKKNVFHNAVRKHGYTSFKRYILSFYNTYQDAVEEERFIVNKTWVQCQTNYNMALGGGGYMFAGLSSEEVSNLYRGSKNHRFGKAAINRRVVLQYDLEGNYIKEFASASLVGEELNILGTNISSCCLGKYSQSGGFIFRYKIYSEKEKEQLDINLKKRCRLYRPDGTWAMSEEIKNKPRKIKRPRSAGVSLETRLRQSIARKGKKLKPCSEERKKKIGDANRGRVFSDDIRKIYKAAQFKRKKPVLKFDLTGNFICEYESLRDAARDGLDRWAIKKNIEGESRHHNFFVFKFKHT